MCVGGGERRGVAAWENRGQEAYGRQESRVREVGLPLLMPPPPLPNPTHTNTLYKNWQCELTLKFKTATCICNLAVQKMELDEGALLIAYAFMKS